MFGELWQRKTKPHKFSADFRICYAEPFIRKVKIIPENIFLEIELVDKFGGDPRQFIADHPFLFFIQDDTTGAKLFSGVVYDPNY